MVQGLLSTLMAKAVISNMKWLLVLFQVFAQMEFKETDVLGLDFWLCLAALVKSMFLPIPYLTIVITQHLLHLSVQLQPGIFMVFQLFGTCHPEQWMLQ